MKRTFGIVVLSFFTLTAAAQQLTYKPMNPFFGGDTFNYQFMLSSANAQNSFKDPAAAKPVVSTMDQFSERLKSQLLSQLSRQLFDNQIGGELKEGSFVLGNLSIEIYESGEGMVINMLNTESGEQTQIIVPSY
ncbi:curli assembly protein CsgF [Flavobacterium sp. JP2137]|uniref:curli assembly protein CsgF n=1 Tax=Flavobacterium sp. JP2137 TaxID=3414510 RepID=UPI003D2FAA9F